MDQRVKARTGGLYLVLKTLKLSGESFQLSFQFSEGLFRRFTFNRNTCELRSDQLLVREIFAAALDERAARQPKSLRGRQPTRQVANALAPVPRCESLQR
jgi:hypothetical protein